MVRHADNKPAENMAKAKRTKKKQQCNDCDQQFSRRVDLQQHRRDEHVQKKNCCSICKRSFESPKRLKMHSQFHNTGGEFECFYCQKQFNKAWKMKIHLVNHSGRPSFVCQFCGDDFLYPGKIIAHLKRIHDVWWACKECGEVFYNDYPDNHLCKIYGCKDCLQCFATKPELATHVKIHSMKRDNSDSPIDLTEVADPASPQPVATSNNLQHVKEEDLAREIKTENQSQQPQIESVQQMQLESLQQVQGQVVQQAQVQCIPLVPVEGAQQVQVQGVQSEGVNHSQVQGPEHILSENPKRRVVVRFLNFGTRERPEIMAINDFVEEKSAAFDKVTSEDGTQDQNVKTSTSHEVQNTLKSEDELTIKEEVLIEQEDIKEEVLPIEQSSFDLPVAHSNCDVSTPLPQPEVVAESVNSTINSVNEFKVEEFKVPDTTTMNRWRKYEKSNQNSLHKKQDVNKLSKKKDKFFSKVHLFDGANTNLKQWNKASFEAWLTSEGYSTTNTPNNDFVFGCEANVGVKSQEKELQLDNCNRIVPKKEEMNMTFEDLCQF